MARHGAGAVLGSLAVMAVAGGFLSYAAASVRTAGAGAETLAVRAVFPSSSGIATGAPVELAGIPVGHVTAISLDRRTFLADVDMVLDRRIAVPSDSRFAIAGGSGSGLVAITPGHATTVLANGASVTNTESAESLEQEVGNYIFGGGGLGDH